MKNNGEILRNRKKSYHKQMSGKQILQVLERLKKDTLSKNEREKEIIELLVKIDTLTEEKILE